MWGRREHGKVLGLWGGQCGEDQGRGVLVLVLELAASPLKS